MIKIILKVCDFYSLLNVLGSMPCICVYFIVTNNTKYILLLHLILQVNYTRNKFLLLMFSL